MKVTVRLSDENTFHVTVPDNSTVEDLKIASLVALPPQADLNSRTAKLWYSGKKMEFSSLLSSYGISPDSKSTVYLTSNDDVTPHEASSSLSSASPSSSTTSAIADADEAVEGQHHLIQHTTVKKTRTKSKGKNRCSFGSCHAPALRMTGECQFCKGKFCSKHRLLEKHNCKGLKTCKDKCFERNALKLRSEQTVASKV
ncbi:DEKNAAC103642 [Brettanomyces naardenensis]|uniref:DEKNAAC103642 n=1 Tax=Brettanomyces naardenensis TaxID=13370 RepID=A0A448YNB4_BRENA|nr:DEKNAAC103642 [Brettanomyces naardenensis]